MRYIINTIENEGMIGIQIDKWVKDKQVEIIEKADPAAVIATHLERAAKALEVLKRAGYDSEVMEIYVQKKSGLGMGDVKKFMTSQKEFFRAIGIR